MYWLVFWVILSSLFPFFVSDYRCKHKVNIGRFLFLSDILNLFGYIHGIERCGEYQFSTGSCFIVLLSRSAVWTRKRKMLTLHRKPERFGPLPLLRPLVHRAGHLLVVVVRGGNQTVFAAYRHRSVRPACGAGGVIASDGGNPVDGGRRLAVCRHALRHHHRLCTGLDGHDVGGVLGLGCRWEEEGVRRQSTWWRETQWGEMKNPELRKKCNIKGTAGRGGAKKTGICQCVCCACTLRDVMKFWRKSATKVLSAPQRHKYRTRTCSPSSIKRSIWAFEIIF